MNKFKVFLGTCLLLILSMQTLAASPEVEKKQAEIRKTTATILNDLYKVQPAAKKAVAASAGYAVFSNFGMKILVAGGGTGTGMAISQEQKKEVFMKMVEVQAGLGFGIKKFRLVFVFENQAAWDKFVSSGWEAGGQATAAATDGKIGAAYQGALAVSPGVWLYQLTDKGLALELTVKGTKYYKDDELN